MSHFIALVLIPKGLPSREEVEDVVGDILAPYDENTQVEGYDKPCSCTNWAAAKKAAPLVAEKFPGGIDTLRESFHAVNPRNPDETEEESDLRDVKWQEHIKDYVDYDESLTAKFAAEDGPDPKCDDCNGTGVYQSTYNPKSKWDWWTIGGRWTGFLVPEYNPREDPENIEECKYCHGTGTRTDFPIWDGNPLGDGKITGYETGKCNTCDGKGRSVKWTLREFGGDIVPANKWLALLDQDFKKFSPFAIVTPDGEWYEQGKMGWWAFVSDAKKPEEWQNEVKSLVEKYANECDVVVVDLHI